MQQFKVPNLYKGVHIDKGHSRIAVDMPEMHVHSFHELYFLLSGKRRYFVGHKIYDVVPGNLVIIPQTVLHRTNSINNQGYERYVVYFQESFIDELIQSVGNDRFAAFLDSGCISFSEKNVLTLQQKLEQYQVIHKLHPYSLTLKQKLEQLENESNNQDSLTSAMEKNLLEQIILFILRYGTKKELEEKEGADKIQIAARYISEHYNEEITLPDIAAMTFMEETYFSKKFKQLTGFGFKEYLISTRVKAAENLLKTTKLSVGEIADSCGFSSSNYFGSVFKRLLGVSPANYRKRVI